jgi:hypothetical protein
MEQARLVLRTNVLGRSKIGRVYAGLSLKLNELSFPHPDWSDFVVVILSWWCQAAMRLLQGSSSSAEVRFMEGPFRAELHTTSSAAWHISLVEAGLSRKVHCSTEIEADSLIRSILETSQQVLRICKEQNWWSSDADDLESATATLRKAWMRAASR